MPPPCPVGTDVARAAEIVRAGGLVALPTETVYGLGGDAFNPAAVARIFEAKGRPHFDPLIVHLAEVSWLPRVAARVSPVARRLVERFWPGPLTLVLPKTDAVPDLVTSGLASVAVRVPAHPAALALLRAADVPIAAPSANRFGGISPTTAAHVIEQLGDRIDYVLDGGPCAVGVESTVLELPADGDATARPRLLRPGGVALEELEAAIGPIDAAPRTQLDEAAAPAPGMLARHYAPTTPLLVVDLLPGNPRELETRVARFLGESFRRVLPNASVASGKPRLGLLTLAPSSLPLDAMTPLFDRVETLSSTGDLCEAAAGFFAALRRLDAAGLDLIVATPFPETGLGRALNDRLRRAATAL